VIPDDRWKRPAVTAFRALMATPNCGAAWRGRDSTMRPVDPELRTLRNLNHPGDYQNALRDAGLRDEDAPERS